MHYYEVAPNRIVRATSSVFTYEYHHRLPVGSLVTIPVGKKVLPGVVVREVARPSFTTRPIDSLITATPLPSALVETALWMAAYYATPLGLVLQTILPKGLTTSRRKTHAPTRQHPVRSRTKNVLTSEQQSTLQQISKATKKTILLHGVTGSGKTLVYITAAKEVIARGQSVIILVPEIALTSQLVDEFTHHFDTILLTHSRQTEAERHLAWLAALESEKPTVVIGPRSALFMPLAKVGLIVIDECHEPSFKQEQSPRYSALRTASVLGKHHGAAVVLGSATPSITDYYLAGQSSAIVSMTSPAQPGTVKPAVQLVDMTKRGNFRRHRFISDTMITAITSTLEAGHQVLLFHNRRGTASTTLCEQCGWLATDPETLLPLTLHADAHVLRSHVTGKTWPIPTSCPECGSTDIIHKGIGTKLIETEIAKLFPNKIIVRFDGDNDETVDKRYGELYDGRIQIMIGTQVLAKGLDLPHLRTVGVIQADAGLLLPDYGAGERTFQLLSQVVGRVGRNHHTTDVIIQSYQPTHAAITYGITQDYYHFYQTALRERRRSHFPPFCFLLKLTCVYKTEAAAIRNAKNLAQSLRTAAPTRVDILGPTPAFYERSGSTYRWQLILKSPKRQDLIDIIPHLRSAHWHYELDPMSLL